jgi:hypothetical protein
LKAAGRKPGGARFVPGTWHLLLEDGKEITSHESRFDQHYPGWRDLPEIPQTKRQMIVMSAWKCRGVWYHNAWAVDGETILELAPHYRGVRKAQDARARNVAAVTLIKSKYPQTRDFPVVEEH